ncbi:MAG TPA: endonuclease/exonuclease/phosphatase family protein [Steroidobacteraceae bacterium]|nr:endonuclease/exonuclease/phosphatase family protein [Steroidobacteraceae bacterium]
MKSRALSSLTLLFATGVVHALANAPSQLKIATWNLEWFMTPETLRALTPACLPADSPRDGARRAVPCDVAHELARSNEDIAALRRHARHLDADVVSLQEVDGIEAARLVFPGYEFCFSSRVAVQNNGFAIRHGLPFHCGPDVQDLSLHDDVRRGVELRLFPGTPRELRLLSVHLKSGCSRDALDSTRPNCVQLRAQVPFLEHWIDAQAAARVPFAVLGDFNRDLRREPAGLSLWADIDDSDPQDADLVNTAEGQAFQNCSPGQTFSGYIDYIILGRQMARGLVKDSFGRELFRPKDALRRKLSDHCPVFIRIRVADAAADLS